MKSMNTQYLNELQGFDMDDGFIMCIEQSLNIWINVPKHCKTDLYQSINSQRTLYVTLMGEL